MDARYFVEAADAQRYGPADLATLREWVAMGRLTPTSILIEATSGERTTAGEIAGLFDAPGSPPPVIGAAPMTPPRRNRTALWIGTALFGILCLCGLPVAAVLFPVLAQARLAARRTVGLTNVKKLGTATLIYASDHDDTFPPRMETVLALRPTLSPYLPQDGDTDEEGSIYRTVNPNGGELLGNAGLGGRSTTSIVAPDATILFYDRLTWPGGRGPVAYVDGSARTVDHAKVLRQVARDPSAGPAAKGHGAP